MLANNTAVITGSNRGIGLETLKIFSKNKCTIFACSRKLDKKFLEIVKDIELKYKNEIIPINLDLENKESVKKSFDEINSYKKKSTFLLIMLVLYIINYFS